MYYTIKQYITLHSHVLHYKAIYYYYTVMYDTTKQFINFT